MATPVIMPKLEMSQETATVVEWLKRDGERVEKGESLLEIETDKVTVEVESPASGLLAGVQVEAGQVVPVTEIIAYVLAPGEVPPSVPPTGGDEGRDAPQGQGGAATPVAQRLAAARDVDLSTIAGSGSGGRITKADVQAALAPPPDKVRATPAARRVARERAVDLAAVSGSGPRGRVQAVDVLGFAPQAVPERATQVVPLAGMRRAIAERMTASYQTAPHITLTVRVDMGGFEAVRALLNAKAEAKGQTRVSVTALVVKAVAWALRRHPWLNSTLREGEIHLLPEVNVGVAVALPPSVPPRRGDKGGGLIVPVVRQADRKDVGEIAAEVNDLVNRAREGRLMPSDVTGGTFTISNLGPFGIEQFTAIINPPQASILALGAIQQEVTVDAEGEVVVRPVMRMTLSADHRVVDGALAARFLSDLREVLETPALLLW